MPDRNLDGLQGQLLSAGIAPRHAKRLAEELKAHLTSLIEEELALGATPEAARTQALKRLGTTEQLVAKALEQPALKSWGARWPVLVCALTPVLCLLITCAMLAFICAAIAIFYNFEPQPTITPTSPGAFVRWGIAALITVGLYGMPIVWAVLFGQYAATRRLRSLWPIVGMVLTTAIGAVTHLQMIWPSHESGGLVQGGIFFSSQSTLLTALAVRGIPSLILAFGVYFLAVRRQSHYLR